MSTGGARRRGHLRKRRKSPDEQLDRRVLGCVMSSAIGDACGAPAELLDAQRLERRIGACWVDDLLPCDRGLELRPLGVQRDGEGDADAHGGMWPCDAPAS